MDTPTPMCPDCQKTKPADAPAGRYLAAFLEPTPQANVQPRAIGWGIARDPDKALEIARTYKPAGAHGGIVILLLDDATGEEHYDAVEEFPGLLAGDLEPGTHAPLTEELVARHRSRARSRVDPDASLLCLACGKTHSDLVEGHPHFRLHTLRREVLDRIPKT